MILISEFLISVYDSFAGSVERRSFSPSRLHPHQRSRIQGNIIFVCTEICVRVLVRWIYVYMFLFFCVCMKFWIYYALPFIGLLWIHEKEWPELCNWKQLTLISCICGMLDRLRRFWSIPFHAYSGNCKWDMLFEHGVLGKYITYCLVFNLTLVTVASYLFLLSRCS